MNLQITNNDAFLNQIIFRCSKFSFQFRQKMRELNEEDEVFENEEVVNEEVAVKYEKEEDCSK